MDEGHQDDRAAVWMRVTFESALPRRIERAAQVSLQHFIPAHWFSAAASDCANMFIDGYFYGTISIAQAYVEALSRFLIEHHRLRGSKDPLVRFRRLRDSHLISAASYGCAERIFSDRNDFHHLNKDVEQEYFALEARARQCVLDLHGIESEVFACTIQESGALKPEHPEYWPRSGDQTLVQLRNLY